MADVAVEMAVDWVETEVNGGNVQLRLADSFKERIGNPEVKGIVAEHLELAPEADIKEPEAEPAPESVGEEVPVPASEPAEPAPEPEAAAEPAAGQVRVRVGQGGPERGG